MTLALLQSLGTSPVLQDLSKMMESGSAMTSASSLSTQVHSIRAHGFEGIQIA